MKWIKILPSIEKAQELIPVSTSKLVKIGYHRICLSNVNGDFRAIQDACPHSSQSLSQGKINYLGEIVCPLHGYRFDMKTGREVDHKCRDAKTYRIRVDEQGVSICL